MKKIKQIFIFFIYTTFCISLSFGVFLFFITFKKNDVINLMAQTREWTKNTEEFINSENELTISGCVYKTKNKEALEGVLVRVWNMHKQGGSFKVAGEGRDKCLTDKNGLFFIKVKDNPDRDLLKVDFYYRKDFSNGDYEKALYMPEVLYLHPGTELGNFANKLHITLLTKMEFKNLQHQEKSGIYLPDLVITDLSSNSTNDMCKVTIRNIGNIFVGKKIDILLKTEKHRILRSVYGPGVDESKNIEFKLDIPEDEKVEITIDPDNKIEERKKTNNKKAKILAYSERDI